MTNVRTRMAPSPTGSLHVGTARATLFNELFARRHGGRFIMRIEDTDKARSTQEFEEGILAALRWLGIAWDEGPDTGGPSGPYRQSERSQQYQEALQALLDSKKAYYCTCRPTTPEKGAAPAPLYSCPCLTAPTTVDQETAAIRLLVTPQEVTFTDVVRGEIAVHTDTFGGNFVIARSLTDPLYHLAVVVDDAAMNITHVIRGDDHISNTPKHILLQQALGYPTPVYAHAPLLLDEQRRKLSKRANDTDLLHYRDAGYLPEGMLNYLALLGWSPKTNQEFFTHAELQQAFSLEGIQKGGALFSLTKLNDMNKHYLNQLTPADLVARTRPFLEERGAGSILDEKLLPALLLERGRSSTLVELAQRVEYLFIDPLPAFEPGLLRWKKGTAEQAYERLERVKAHLSTLSASDFTETGLKESLMTLIDTEGLGRGDTLWPMRVALTGQEHSSGPFEVAAVLGKERTLDRLTAALGTLQG